MLIFPKPQPLSPRTQAEFVDGRWRKKRGSKTVLRGVPATKSVYYIWFEYLKRSERYKEICNKKGKTKNARLRDIYNDFGDVFQYDNDDYGFTEQNDFYYKWWEERGKYLFGVPAVKQISSFLSYDEITSLKKEIDSEQIFVFTIPTSMSKIQIRKRLKNLISNMEVFAKKSEDLSPKYNVLCERVDTESLRECLEAYDLHVKGVGNKEIFAHLNGLTDDEKQWALKDMRGERGMLEDWTISTDDDFEDEQGNEIVETEDWRQQVDKATAYADEKMQWRYKQRVKARGKEWGDKTRKLTDDELDRLREIYIAIRLKTALPTLQAKERANRKNYMNSSISRMIKRAKKNIEAVERGSFCVTF